MFTDVPAFLWSGFVFAESWPLGGCGPDRVKKLQSEYSGARRELPPLETWPEEAIRTVRRTPFGREYTCAAGT